jgi:hypothetical protein
MMLRYYAGIDPATLTIEEWALAIANIELIRKNEGSLNVL